MFARTRIRASVIAALAVTFLAGVLITKGQGRAQSVGTDEAPAITADDLAAAARTKVFFDHQSVGGNVVDAIAGVYDEHGLAAPRIVALTDTAGAAAQAAPTGRGGYLAHAYFGQNGDPIAKIESFDARIRGGLGSQVDVAFMKLCYVDVNSDTDVDAVFARYRDTMAALERDFPAVTFLHVTTPVTTEPSLKTRVKELLGRDEHLGPADNAARERLNALMRREYGSDHLFDLAAIEATAPDGGTESGTYHGRDYLAMYAGYSADPGHLNAGGSAVAATRLLQLIASSSGSGAS